MALSAMNKIIVKDQNIDGKYESICRCILVHVTVKLRIYIGCSFVISWSTSQTREVI